MKITEWKTATLTSILTVAMIFVFTRTWSIYYLIPIATTFLFTLFCDVFAPKTIKSFGTLHLKDHEGKLLFSLDLEASVAEIIKEDSILVKIDTELTEEDIYE